MKYSVLLILSFILINTCIGQKKRFHPDGYYFTETAIQNNEWIFEWLSVMTESIKDVKSSVTVRFRNSKTKKWIDITTTDYTITEDGMQVTFKDYRIGQLSFQGKFIPLQTNTTEKHTTNFDFISTFTYKDQTKPIKFSITDGD